MAEWTEQKERERETERGGETIRVTNNTPLNYQ